MVMNHDRGCLGPRFFSFVYDNGDGTVRSLTLRGVGLYFFNFFMEGHCAYTPYTRNIWLALKSCGSGWFVRDD